MNIRYFKANVTKRDQLSHQTQLIVGFGFFAISTNFTGVEIGRKNQVPFPIRFLFYDIS